MSNPSSNQQLSELVGLIHRFFAHQIETNTELTEAAKESLTVAIECMEQAYQIEKKTPSGELLEIYRSNQRQQQTSQRQANGPFGAQGPFGPNPGQFITNLASTILTQATAGVRQPVRPNTNTNISASNTTSASAPQTETASSTTPKVRKTASEAEKLAAESFKCQGNEFMKQDKYKEAYDSYTRAIEIDDNNAIYYSNRAAASSKLGDHKAALEDSKEAVEIDSTYSKAYGRMGLAYASMHDHQRAKDALSKAVELDPNNESYRNNLKIAEEKLRTPVYGNEPNTLWIWRSHVPDSYLAAEIRRNPGLRIFDLADGPPGPGRTPIQISVDIEQPATNTQHNSNTNSSNPADNNPQSAPNQQPSGNNTNQPSWGSTAGINPADMINMASRIAASANMDLVGAGQQLLSTLQQNNPDVLNNMLLMMNQAFTRPPNQNQNQNQNEDNRDPPPGYS